MSVKIIEFLSAYNELYFFQNIFLAFSENSVLDPCSLEEAHETWQACWVIGQAQSGFTQVLKWCTEYILEIVYCSQTRIEGIYATT